MLSYIDSPKIDDEFLILLDQINETIYYLKHFRGGIIMNHHIFPIRVVFQFW